MPEINLRHLNEYKHIFGNEKMRRLWQEFITFSTQSWQQLSEKDLDGRRLIFHNWKSSSKVFGMEEFSRHCARIEENILKRRGWESLSDMVSRCRTCYQHSINEVTAYFDGMDKSDEQRNIYSEYKTANSRLQRISLR